MWYIKSHCTGVFEITVIILSIAVALVAAAGVFGGFTAYKKGFASGVEHRKQIAEAQFGSAEEKARSIVAEAERTADSKKTRSVT